MQHVSGRTLWRANFIGGLELLAQATARLPFGVPDPVLCGDAAVELYTGGLWSIADLEVLAADARLLTAELFALGFRWTERPRHAERGLWHPELQIGIDIIECRAAPSMAELSNRLVVGVDVRPIELEDTAPVPLKVVGIEDLIAQQVGYWLSDGHRSGVCATRLQALAELGQGGVGGLFRDDYLQRRLDWETRGEVALELFPSTEGRAQTAVARTTTLTDMQALISTWCDRCGLLLAAGRTNTRDAGWSGGDPVRMVGGRNDMQGRAGRPGKRSANIVPFDAALPRSPD
jgi:hypothetical protein